MCGGRSDPCCARPGPLYRGGVAGLLETALAVLMHVAIALASAGVPGDLEDHVEVEGMTCYSAVNLAVNGGFYVWFGCEPTAEFTGNLGIRPDTSQTSHPKSRPGGHRGSCLDRWQGRSGRASLRERRSAR